MTTQHPYLTPWASGFRLTLHVQPKASVTAIKGVHGDALKLAVQAPPVDGVANEAVLKFVAELFCVPVRNVTLDIGEKSRRKVVGVMGVPMEIARARLTEALKP